MWPVIYLITVRFKISCSIRSFWCFMCFAISNFLYRCGQDPCLWYNMSRPTFPLVDLINKLCLCVLSWVQSLSPRWKFDLFGLCSMLSVQSFWAISEFLFAVRGSFSGCLRALEPTLYLEALICGFLRQYRPYSADDCFERVRGEKMSGMKHMLVKYDRELLVILFR